LAKRREEKKIRRLLDEAKKYEGLDFSSILEEGTKRIRFFEKKYEDLKRSYKNRYYNRKEPNDMLPSKRSRFHEFGSKVILEPHKSIFPGFNYPKITNFVVTVHFGKDGKDLYVDQHRIPLYLPNAVKNNSFAAVIIPQDGATALFFSNCKTVMTGTTTPESALHALQMYRLSLSRVLQPVIVYDDSYDPPRETYEICYLKTILDFTGFKGTNTVGSGPIAKDGYTVDLSALIEVYPETNWKPEIFPGLKFHLPEGNKVIPEGKKCTAHLFEGRIVLMGLEDPEHIVIAYYFFLELVKPFLDKSSPDYEEDRYSYRYKQMLWKLNEPTEREIEAQEAERDRLRRTFKCGPYAEYVGTDDSISINVSDASSSVTVSVVDKKNANDGCSLFDFDIKDQLPAEMVKKMKATMKTSSKIKNSNVNNGGSAIRY
jgi:TATA-box binding protein (TBP) (component of TFIID and TFIIIB)